jgi:flagellar hook protein FlgE
VPLATTIGATTATLASVAGLAVGSNISIGGNPGALTIATIGVPTANDITFAPATTAATGINAAVTGVPTPLTQLTFNSLGALTSTTPATTPVGTVISGALFPASQTVSPTQTISFNFGSPTAGTTQYGGAFAVSTLTQDGFASGHLNSTSTGTDGIITGRYSNGQTRPLGQIILANFTGVQGLQPIGNNEWVQTAASGNPLIGAPGSSSLGVLQSSATEDSNVDMTAELVNMITAQRTYQANAQTIKTQDQLLQTIVSLR